MKPDDRGLGAADPLTLDEMMRLSRDYPGCALRGRGIEFMGGRDSECGFVPLEWNGRTVILEKKR